MYNGYNKIFWGIIIATFHINLGMIKILPAFVGFMLISSGISSLYEETEIESFNKSKNFALIIIVTSFLGDLMGFLSINVTDFFILNEVWIIFHSIMELMMFYKCFEGSVEYFKVNNQEELAEENIKKMRFYIKVVIVNIIALNFALMFNITALNIIASIVMIVLRIYLMMWAHELRNRFVEEETII